MSSDELATTRQAYRIDPAWYEAQDRSLEQVLASRMCSNHTRGVAVAEERRRAVPDPATGELRFVTEAPADDPFDRIAQCCATRADFITPMMPLMESVFRVFLAKGNVALTPEEIHDELRAWFAASPRSRYFTVETIAKLLENDRAYGILPEIQPALAGD